jgi:hypothetical protein
MPSMFVDFFKIELEIDSTEIVSLDSKNDLNTKKFNLNENALAYIFDLYADGMPIPQNEIDGGYTKKGITKDGIEMYQFENNDSFYRAVRKVANYDLNKVQHLENISKRWLDAIKKISKNWIKVEKYLRSKELIGE